MHGTQPQGGNRLKLSMTNANHANNGASLTGVKRYTLMPVGMEI